MAINLQNKVSESDKREVKDSMSAPEWEDGFAPDDYSDNDSSNSDIQWDSLDDIVIDDNQSQGSNFNLDQFSNTNLGTNNSNASGVQKEDGLDDKLLNFFADYIKDTFNVIREIPDSIRNRTLDDYGYYGATLLNVGVIQFIIALVVFIIEKFIGISSTTKLFTLNIVLAGVVVVSFGIIALFISAYLLGSGIELERHTVDDVGVVCTDGNGEEISDDDLWDALMSDDDAYEEDDSEDEFDVDINDEDTSMFDTLENNRLTFSKECDKEDREIDYDNELDNIHEGTYINREVLVDTFSRMLGICTPGFDESIEIDKDSDEYSTIDAICTKVFSNLLNVDIYDVNNHVESVKRNIFSYEIFVKRIKKLTRTQDIEREVEGYFRDDPSDLTVTANVDIIGDFYRIIVSTGEVATVTFGDVLRYDKYKDKILDRKIEIPLICGVDALGNVIIEDGKTCYSMMIAGKPRSGKSWYVLQVLMSFMLFSLPEAVQLVLVDPKKTQLYKAMSLMPHVCGLHDDSNIIEVLDDIINNEAEARKKVLMDNKCDDIWELWDKGIKMPVLYVVLDEYITIVKSLGENSGALESRLLVLMTQLPSQGIMVLFIPHRATGIVDRKNRSQLQFVATVRSDISDTKDSLDCKKWERPLVNMGDAAIKTPSLFEPIYVRGVAVESNNEKNRKLIINAAKAYYKMGVDVPDMSRMRVACNRNPDEIREELYSDGSIHEQYSASNIFSDLN